MLRFRLLLQSTHFCLHFLYVRWFHSLETQIICHRDDGSICRHLQKFVPNPTTMASSTPLITFILKALT